MAQFEMKPEEYLSVFAWSILQPIVDLWSKLEAKPEAKPNEVQTSLPENGLSISIIILTMTVVESLLNKTRYAMHCRKSHVIPAKNKEPLVEFFRRRFNNKGLADKLRELYVLRDVIIHNYIWEAEIVDNGELKFAIPPKLIPGHGDNKYKSVLNPANRCSKILGLNLFPTKIWRQDVKTVLQVAYEVLYHIESQDSRYCVISWAQVMYRRKGMEFSEFIRRISGTYMEPPPIAELAD